MSKWRYQPVITVDVFGGKTFSICEVYFDEQGRLNAWTEEAFIHALGDDLDELRRDLCLMLANAMKWEPVLLADMKVGMTFERAAPHGELADMIHVMAYAK